MASLSFQRPFFALPPWLRRGTKAYDLLAGAPLILFYGLSATGRIQSLFAALSTFDLARIDYATAVTILSDIATLSGALLFVACVVLRPPPIARASGLMPRLAAVAGTYLSVGMLLLSPPAVSQWAMGASLFLVLCGTAFAVYAVFYLGRSVSLVAEARKLVTGGPYRFVRHPLYVGEQIAIAGALLPHISVLTVLVFAVQVAFQFYRMDCEEKVLSATFPEYENYARDTWRILPGLY